MFASFFGSFHSSDWKLRPSKFPRESQDHFSSKVLLPYYILGELVNENIQPPYVFEITHENGIYRTSCSVLDFALDDNDILMPSWMYEQLNLEEGEEVVLKHIKVEKGKGICLLPHSVDFLELENPKKDLEKTFTNYHVLSSGDEILLNFADIGRCRFTITKIIPEFLSTIYIVDTDLQVDFHEPIGYKEKIESEKSVMKHVEIKKYTKDGINLLKMKKLGLFFDWEGLNNQS